MVADIEVLLPKEIHDKFEGWFLQDEKITAEVLRTRLLDISILMKKHLAEIDKQITELLE